MKTEHAKSHDPLTLSEQAVSAQDELHSILRRVMGLAQVTRVRDLFEVVAEAFAELETLKKDEIELGKKLGFQRPSAIRRKIAALSEVPSHWEMDDPATKTLVDVGMPMAVASFIALASTLPDEKAQKAYEQFISEKAECSAYGWMTVRLKFPLNRFEAAQRNKQARLGLPPNAMVGLEHNGTEWVANYWREANKDLHAKWAKRLDEAKGDRKLALELLMPEEGRLNVYGIDQQLKDEMDLPDDFWPTEHNGPVLTWEIINQEVEA